MLEEKSDVCDTKRIAEKQAAERAYKTLVVGRLEHIYLIEGVPRGLQGVPRGGLVPLSLPSPPYLNTKRHTKTEYVVILIYTIPTLKT